MSDRVHPPRPIRRFVPQDLTVESAADLQPLYQALLDRPIDSPAELEKWLADASELIAVERDGWVRRFIDKSCQTDDPALERRYLQWIQEIDPALKPLLFALEKKFLQCPHRSGLTDRRYAMLERTWRTQVEIYRDENVPLEAAEKKLVSDYDKLCGAMMITFRGKEYTQQQLAQLLEETDRQTRQESWIAGVERRLADREAIDAIFDQLVQLRHRMAQNAGLANYREYIWKDRERFDYTPADCQAFHESVAKVCMPLLHELNDQRARDLQLNSLRPWDLQVDPAGRQPLRPFAENEIERFLDTTRSIFDRLSTQLAEQFDGMRRNRDLDLATRKGKQPGGYQVELSESGRPFIFMNAVGMNRDVETLLHEGGHAFHSLAAHHEPLMFLRHAPIEFCEVASMTMELFGIEHLDLFYDPADHARARRMHLEWIVSLLPWISAIDSFQHWIYTHPQHSREERTARWKALVDRFTDKLDWSGFAAARASWWHKQLHLFSHPFYYIEYGIAQIGSLQLWLKSKQDPQRALANYRAALALGGTRPLPELFAAAGIRFDFSEKTLKPLMQAVRDELSDLPA